MVVAFDAVGPAGGAGTIGGSPLSWTHVLGASANLILVDIAYCDFTFGTVPMTATCGGVAMAVVGEVNSNNNTAGFVRRFALANPPTGSQTIVVTRTSGSVAAIIGGSVSYSAAGTLTTTTAFGNTATPTITVSSNVGDMVSATMCDGQGFTAANQTLRYRRNDNTVTASGNLQGEDAAGAASVTLTGTTAATDWWAVIATNIAASGGGAAARVAYGQRNRVANVRASTW